MKSILKRLEYSDKGTFGEFTLDGFTASTLELPWRNNARFISCIPKGIYKCTKYHSSQFGLVYLVQDVPDRDGILIHPGNSIKDTEGCILMGASRVGNSIIDSVKTLKRFTRYTEWHDFELEIIDETVPRPTETH